MSLNKSLRDFTLINFQYDLENGHLKGEDIGAGNYLKLSKCPAGITLKWNYKPNEETAFSLDELSRGFRILENDESGNPRTFQHIYLWSYGTVDIGVDSTVEIELNGAGALIEPLLGNKSGQIDRIQIVESVEKASIGGVNKLFNVENNLNLEYFNFFISANTQAYAQIIAGIAAQEELLKPYIEEARAMLPYMTALNGYPAEWNNNWNPYIKAFESFDSIEDAFAWMKENYNVSCSAYNYTIPYYPFRFLNAMCWYYIDNNFREFSVIAFGFTRDGSLTVQRGGGWTNGAWASDGGFYAGGCQKNNGNYSNSFVRVKEWNANAEKCAEVKAIFDKIEEYETQLANLQSDYGSIAFENRVSRNIQSILINADLIKSYNFYNGADSSEVLASGGLIYGVARVVNTSANKLTLKCDSLLYADSQSDLGFSKASLEIINDSELATAKQLIGDLQNGATNGTLLRKNAITNEKGTFILGTNAMTGNLINIVKANGTKSNSSDIFTLNAGGSVNFFISGEFFTKKLVSEAMQLNANARLDLQVINEE